MDFNVAVIGLGYFKIGIIGVLHEPLRPVSIHRQKWYQPPPVSTKEPQVCQVRRKRFSRESSAPLGTIGTGSAHGITEDIPDDARDDSPKGETTFWANFLEGTVIEGNQRQYTNMKLNFIILYTING